MIVSEHRAEVQQDQVQEQNNTSEIKASADSAVPQNLDVITTHFENNGYVSIKELKEVISFRSLLQSDGHDLEQSGSYVKCCCPFHDDNTPSFFIYKEDNYGKCYGCEWHGDIFAYEMAYNSLDFIAAWKNLDHFQCRSFQPPRIAKPARKKSNTHATPFSPNQLAERQQYTERLATESWLAEEVCRKRFEHSGEKWNPNTIQQLAKEGSLGWASGALAFIYSSGTKYRDWPKKDMLWEPFSSSLWRDHLLLDAKHIYLTESETDAIALLDAGIEQEEGVAIVAASGASAFQEDWAVQFTGKKVTLCFDNDAPGIKGANKAGGFIKTYASELFILDLGGAQ